MAAPHVAGVMALFLQENPALTPQQLHGMVGDNATQSIVTDAKSANAHLLNSIRTVAAPPPPPSDTATAPLHPRIPHSRVETRSLCSAIASSARSVYIGMHTYQELPMKITARELRVRSKYVLEAVDRGEEVLITYRGRPRARVVPAETGTRKPDRGTGLFGLWRDHEAAQDVDAYVDSQRKGRF
jgi:prevent-host-death family protein